MVTARSWVSSLAADMYGNELMGSPSGSDLSESDLSGSDLSGSDLLGFDQLGSDHDPSGEIIDGYEADGYAAEAGTIADPEQDEHALLARGYRALAIGTLLKRRRIIGKRADPVRELRAPGRNRFRASCLGISPRPATYIQVC
jgi:hypothetical protein